MIRAGDGPAFLSFHARDTAALHGALRAGGYPFSDAGGLTDLQSPQLGFLFWIQDNRSPTDCARALRPSERRDGAGRGVARHRRRRRAGAPARAARRAPGASSRSSPRSPAEATVVTLAEGDVVILPARHQLLPGRPIIGASFRVRDLATVRRALAAGGVSPWTGPGSTDRVVVEPSKAHGLWLEFVAG